MMELKELLKSVFVFVCFFLDFFYSCEFLYLVFCWVLLLEGMVYINVDVVLFIFIWCMGIGVVISDYSGICLVMCSEYFIEWGYGISISWSFGSVLGNGFCLGWSFFWLYYFGNSLFFGGMMILYGVMNSSLILLNVFV